LRLRDNVGTVRGASPKSAFHEKCVQIPQGVYGNARCTKFHGRAAGGIGHPGGQYRYNTWGYFDMQYTAVGTLLAVMQPQTAPVTRMPTVVNRNLLPDMGRMNL